MHSDKAVLSELIGVSQQIHEYLLQSVEISIDYLWKVLGVTQINLIRSKFSLHFDYLHDLVNNLLWIHL